MPDVPEDPPPRCAACGRVSESVAAHADGATVNLPKNDRCRWMCFEPGGRDGEAVSYFYHHTHRQADAGGARAGK